MRQPETPRAPHKIYSSGLDAQQILTAAGFALLGASLVWSRVAGLDQSLWRDEIYTVVHYVRPGPEAVFLDEYVPNNHMLFSLLAWLTMSVFGESEIAFRAWSVVPFIAGVALGTAWLRRSFGTLAAGLYLFLATQSTLLLGVSPEARGYGVAFLAMSVLTIAACEAHRSQGRLPVLAFCVAGVIGTWTLPVFGLAFAATSLVLLTQTSVRKRLVPLLVVSAGAIIVWYLPVLDQLSSSSQQEFGGPLPWHAPLTGPVQQLLYPSLSPHDEELVSGAPVAYIALGLLLAAGIYTAYERSRSTAAVLTAGAVGTFLVLTLARVFVEARFVSYLLAPVLTLLALGVARALQAAGSARPLARVLVFTMSGVILVGLSAMFVVSTLEATRWPIEAHKDVAAAIHKLPPTSKIVVNLSVPDDLRFYLRRPVVVPPPQHLQQAVCDRKERDLIYVENGWRTPDVDVGCLERAGATRQRLPQRRRGDWVDVWFLPGTAAGS